MGAVGTGQYVKCGTEDMRFATVCWQREFITFHIDEMGKFVNLASQENYSENNGAEKHPSGTVQITFVNGRNSQSHEQRTSK